MSRLDLTKLGTLALFALGAACSTASVATSGSGGAQATASSGNGGATTTSSTTTNTAAVTTGSVGAGGSGGMACDPPAQAGTFYAQTAEHYGDVAPKSMCDYRGDVVLIVNTAAV
jgi:hypothetical protein